MNKANKAVEAVVMQSDTAALEVAATTFINTSAETVGIAATTQLFEYLNSLMLEEPAFAKKLATPSIQAELSKVAANMKGKKWGLTDLMGALPSLVASLNKIFGK
ncbi:hypothetical protein F5984_18835 [Rudanella paleaurantiibacter]|uniref:Uncharacterized protein n=1 Tax=Rudanella paleaurantiibacter TaxID=2614655 RepID=A0A7J5TWG5_9BACT|nr:hypothetical protein [Rudanella paleaurantiibacter]KAB7728428.1 hypothetical protein F5984_18835 [Rudanella paleaurantiibacter]